MYSASAICRREIAYAMNRFPEPPGLPIIARCDRAHTLGMGCDPTQILIQPYLIKQLVRSLSSPSNNYLYSIQSYPLSNIILVQP